MADCLSANPPYGQKKLKKIRTLRAVGRFRDSKTPTHFEGMADCLSANPPYGLQNVGGGDC